MRIAEWKRVIGEKKNWLIVLLGAVGVLLLFLSEMTGQTKKNKTRDTAGIPDAATYTEQTERRMRSLILSIEGAGDALVMITLDSTGELYLATDEELDESVEQEKTKRSTQTKVVNASDGGIPTADRQPQIRGVAVVCEGAGNSEVRREVTETVRAALGVSRDKIYVAQMKKGS